MYFNDFLREHRGDFDLLISDIDGTLARGTTPLPGAAELIRFCRDTSLPFFLLTNDSNHSLEEKSVIIGRAGLEVSPDEIISAGSMLKFYVEQNQCAGQTYFIMGDLGTPCFAELAGLKICRDPEEIDRCAGVIIGEGRYDWQRFFYAAFNFFIRHPERPLISPNPDSYWPSHRPGEFGIGAGGKARFISTLLKEHGIHLEPHFFGKPYPDIYRYALLKAGNVPPARTIMLGDSLTSDIAGAQATGIASALVMTGITTPAKLAAADPARKPDHIFELLAAAIQPVTC